MDIGNQMRIWHEIRSEALRNDVFSAFLFSNVKNNVFAGHYEPTQLPIRKITNIAQKLKMLGTENPFNLKNRYFWKFYVCRKPKNTTASSAS